MYFRRFAGAKTGYGTICRNPICPKLFGKLSLSQFSANCPVSQVVQFDTLKLRTSLQNLFGLFPLRQSKFPQKIKTNLIKSKAFFHNRNSVY